MLLGGLGSKESAYNPGDLGSIPGLGRSPGEGNGYRLQYSCLENPMDGGAWEATYSPRGRKESDTTAQLTLYFTTGRTQYKMRAPQEIGIIWK